MYTSNMYRNKYEVKILKFGQVTSEFPWSPVLSKQGKPGIPVLQKKTCVRYEPDIYSFR